MKALVALTSNSAADPALTVMFCGAERTTGGLVLEATKKFSVMRVESPMVSWAMAWTAYLSGHKVRHGQGPIGGDVSLEPDPTPCRAG